MPLHLSDYDQALLDGAHGEAARLAMRILVRMAVVFEAETLMDISAAHIDSTVFQGDATMEYAERLAALGAKVAVPTSLNVSGVDEYGWKEWAVPPEWAHKAHRQMVAYRSMGAVQTWTCAPYQTDLRPKFGQQIAWGESNAIAFANSVIGARTERYPDLLDVCCAITGRVPAAGLHLTENRAGQDLLRLVDIPEQVQADEAFYPILGHLIGHLVQNRIPVIDGLVVQPDDDRLKALCAGMASSGAVALCHIVGVTPEAPTLEAAFQGNAPARVLDITLPMLREARRALSTADAGKLDMVVLGSPHFSLDEFRRLAPLLEGKQRHPNVQFLVTTSRMVRMLAEETGLMAPLEAFGGRITVDTCILTTPMLPPEIEVMMTNSAKFAYYTPGLLNRLMAFGSLEDCVHSAVEGRILTDETLWAE